MNREHIFDQERGERAYYQLQKQEAEILLPVTKDGFEALLEVAAGAYNLPVDDKMRQVFAGFVHHVPNEKNTVVLKDVSTVLYKSVSNSLTWTIDQDIKLKAAEEAKKAAEDLRLPQGGGDVVPIKQ